MDRELLRLALVNHALHFDVDHSSAWSIVDAVLAEAGEMPLEVLADQVRLAATDQIYGREFTRKCMPPRT